MNVVVGPRLPRRATRPVPVPAAAIESEHLPVAERSAHRWGLLLLVPFVLGATCFSLAVGLGSEWPMIPAFFLGPFLLTVSYILLMLTSDSNSE
jgi:hypothetical protein